jgi:hypothetical protein
MPIPDDQRPDKDPTRIYKFALTISTLVAGSALLVLGGREGDSVTQTAGGSMVAAVVAVIGYQRMAGGKS